MIVYPDPDLATAVPGKHNSGAAWPLPGNSILQGIAIGIGPVTLDVLENAGMLWRGISMA